MANNKSAFITVEEIVKGALRDTGESNVALYQRFMSWAMDCVNELGFDVLRQLKNVFLSVDSATKTAKLPDDYVQYVKMGLRTSNKEFVPIVPNSSLIIDPEIPECDTVDEHCDCGCNDEVCYAFGESNVTTVFSDVVINGTTYHDSVTTCVQSSGDVIKKTCKHTVTNPESKCDYRATFTRVASELPNIPLANFKFNKNGGESFVGDVENSAALTSIMGNNGFSLVSSSTATIIYIITNSSDVWSGATWIDFNGDSQSISFAQTNCTTVGVSYQQCNYSGDAGSITAGGYTNVVFVVNGVNIPIGTVANSTVLNNILHDYGFTGGIGGIIDLQSSTDVWTKITLHDDGDDKTINLSPYDCTTIPAVAPEVTEYCYEEKICDVEVKPCGCIVVADTDINVINQCCNFACAVTMRQQKNKDFGQTFAQPKGFFGEYKVDLYRGVIQFNSEYQYDGVYMEYYSANLVDSKNYLVPVQAKEPIIAWIYWKTLQRRKNVPMIEKRNAAKEFYNEKRKMKQRLHPLNLDELMSEIRVFQRP